MATLSNRPGYSIAAVSKLTGVSCHALRVWERRYGYPEPQRSPSGHRRYNKEQVVVLRKLTKLAQAGHSIGEVIGDYQAGRLEILEDEAERPGRDSIYSLVVDHLFAGELAEADVLIDLEAERASPIELIERVIEPAMVDIGERWFRGEAQIFQERFATAYLFGRLGRMLDLARRVNLEPTRTVIIGAVEGDHHGGGVLMVGLALEVAGWRALVLGVDIPVEEFQKAINRWRPDALALSFVLSRNITKRFEELSRIANAPVFVGGRSIVNHQGLARRHGLIPLMGTLRASIKQLKGEVETRERRARPAGSRAD